MPPLPEGFTLDAPMPPLPEGYTLDPQPARGARGIQDLSDDELLAIAKSRQPGASRIEDLSDAELLAIARQRSPAADADGPWRDYQSRSTDAGSNPFAKYAQPGAAAEEPNPFAKYDRRKPSGSAEAGPWLDYQQEPKEPGFVDRVAQTASGMAQGIIGGMQGTTPIVRDIKGNLNYQPLGDVWQGELGPEYKAADGTFRPIDPKQHVVLNDPATGKPTVYARSAATDTGALASIGHIVSPGLITNAPVRASTNAAPALGSAKAVEDFAGAGVSPSLPAVTQGPGIGRLAQILKNTPFVGAPIQKGAQRQINQAASEAERVAGSYGDAATPRQAGRTIQEGAEAFIGKEGQAPSGLTADEVVRLPTRSSSFSEKSGVLYDELGKHIKPGQPIALDSTAAALEGPAARFTSNAEFGKSLTDPKFADWLGKLQKSGTLTFDELKEFRSFVGRKLSQPSVVSDIPRADLEKLYGGISEDLRTAAKEAGPGAVRAFDRANSYYSAGRKRIDDALKGFMEQRQQPEGAYADVIAAASEKGKSADVGKLYALRRSMPPDEWQEVASFKIRDMGKPPPGQRDATASGRGNADWSPGAFVTNYEKLSPEARNVLFDATGNASLRQELDRLVRVSGALQNNEKLAERGSGATLATLTAGSGALTGILMGDVATKIGTVLAVVGANRAGAAMMNPAFTRWVTGTANVKSPADWTQRLTTLGDIARVQPELQPAYQALRSATAAADERRGRGDDWTPVQRQAPRDDWTPVAPSQRP